MRSRGFKSRLDEKIAQVEQEVSRRLSERPRIISSSLDKDKDSGLSLWAIYAEKTLVSKLGQVEFDHTFVTEDGEIFYRAGEKFTLNQAMPLLASEEAAERAGNGWRLLDKYGENIAYAERVKYAPELSS